MTCKEIIIDYLKANYGELITHHSLDSVLPNYGYLRFYKQYSPATYHRNYCWVKKDSELLLKNGIELKPEKLEGKNYDAWKIIRKQQTEMELK